MGDLLGFEIHGIVLQELKVHSLQHGLVDCRQNYERCDPSLGRPKPAIDAQSPKISGFE